MSLSALQAVARLPNPERLTTSERLVLFALADRLTSKGCYPSQAAIAAQMGLSPRSVFGALKRLADVGLIEILKARGPSEGGRPLDAYSLILPETPGGFLANSDSQPENFATNPEIVTGKNCEQAPPFLAKSATEEERATYPLSGSTKAQGKTLSGTDRRVIDEFAQAVWSETPPEGQRASDTRKLTFALRDALLSGHDLAAVRRGVQAYYAAHRGPAPPKPVSWVVDDGLWLSAGAAASAPTGDIGSMLQPGPRRQRNWMDDWRRNPGLWKEHKQGPAPDQPNTRVWPEILTEYGVAPPPGAGAGRQPMAPAA